MAGGYAGDGGGSVDPFEEFELDDDFVRAATIVELSAAERAEVDERRRRRAALDRFEAERLADELAVAEQERWRRRRTRAIRTVAWVVLGGLVVWALWSAIGVRASDRATTDPSAELPDLTRYGSADPSGRPSPLGAAASPTPLGTPPPASGPDEGYEFSATQDGSADPVADDPCRPVRYVTSGEAPVEGGEEIVLSAVDELSRATGLQFVDDGPTDEAPTSDRPFFQPDRYGDQWAPVLLVWSDAVETPGLRGSVAGLGGSVYVELTGGDAPSAGKVYVSGAVTLDGPDLSALEEARGSDAVRAVVLHELAHVLGLDHVNDRRQLMYPEGVDGVVDLGAGDRRGLAQLGAGTCHPEV